MNMTYGEFASFVAAGIAFITSMITLWSQRRLARQRDREIEHKISQDVKEFWEKYTSTEKRLDTWVSNIPKPVLSSEGNSYEPGMPYQAGAPITRMDLFYGRMDLLNQIVRAATGTQMASICILGARKSGKTSFLHFIKHSINRNEKCNNIIPVYLDAQRPFDDWDGFFAYMLHESMGALAYKTNKQAPIHEIPNKVPFSLLAEFCAKTGETGWRFLFLLDEFENLQRKDGPFDDSFFGALRSLIVDGHVAWVTASYRFVYEPNTMTSPLGNIFERTLYVGALDPSDARRLAFEPAAKSGNPFDKEDVELILKLAGRLPFLIQKAAMVLYSTHLHDVKGAQARIFATNTLGLELKSHFESQLSYLTEEEISALSRIIQGDSDKVHESILIQLENYGFILKENEAVKILGQTFEDYLFGYFKNKV